MRLRELQASRRRIIAAADAERRRLERDLHDGAQQRLLGLAFELAVPQPATEGLQGEVRAALADLRHLAHGIYPRSLADDGLAAALVELVEGADIPIDISALPDRPVAAECEAVAYLVILRATRPQAARRAWIGAQAFDQGLVIEVLADGDGPSDVVDLEDRVGALDGIITIGRATDGRVRISAELPCAS
jgi:signal transduction histidine kinase